MKHQLLTIKDRRWCVCCDFFQSKKPNENWFLLKSKENCSNDAPGAEANRRAHLPAKPVSERPTGREAKRTGG